MEHLSNFAANQTIFGLLGLGVFFALGIRCLVGIVQAKPQPGFLMGAAAILPVFFGIGACLHHLESVRPHFYTVVADIVHPEAAMDLAIELLVMNASFSGILLALIGVWNYRVNFGVGRSLPVAPLQTMAATRQTSRRTP